MTCAEEMKRNVELVPDYPAVVRIRRNVKELARAKRKYPAVVECGGGGSRYNQTDVLDVAARGPDRWTDMQGPLPPRFVRRAADGEATNVNDLKPALDHFPDFVGLFEALQNHVNHCGTSLHPDFRVR
jgi:hypothetical protein